ncbi:MAG TPA: hypothetical protein VM597_33165 [Gemmataceae bacterium]|jgi:hypothetical protein|nr:hypothetical protein [Gemmataceae bacterium]
MLYLIHCSFTQGGLTPSHGHFDYVVDAPDIASAKDRLRAKLDEERAEGDLFDDPVEIYLDDTIPLVAIPADGVIGRYQMYVGERQTSIFHSTPCDQRPDFDPADQPDDEDEPPGGVVVEPFVVFGPKGG